MVQPLMQVRRGRGRGKVENHDGLSHHAPLSHAQSVAIAKHLQDQINSLNSALNDLTHAHEDTHAKVKDLTDSVSTTNHDVQVLQDASAASKEQADNTRRCLDRTKSALAELQTDFNKASNDILQMKEAQQHADSDAKKMGGELAEAQALALKLKEALKKCQDESIVALRNTLAKQELDLERLKTESLQSQADSQAHRESLREIDARVNTNRDRLGATETQVSIDRNKLEDTIGSLKKTQEDVSNVAILASNLREDHERTKEGLSETRAAVKKVGARTKTVQEGLAKTTKDLEGTAEKLEQAIEKLDIVDSNLVKVHGETRACTQSAEAARQAIHRLNGQVTELQATTHQVRGALKETTSLLLPNIHQDSAEVRNASARHGSLLVGGASNLGGMLSSGGGGYGGQG